MQIWYRCHGIWDKNHNFGVKNHSFRCKKTGTMKKWKEGKEKGEIAIREREMRESENGKKMAPWRKTKGKGVQQ